MKTQIPQSLNYGKFVLHELNRNLRENKDLEKSMETRGWLDSRPMHVVKNGGGKLIIIDGHNRFAIAKKLSIPVKYVICDDKVSMYELEKSTRAWSLEDYMVSYARQGIKAYQEVEKYFERTGISLNCVVSMMGGETAGSTNKRGSFKAGTYKLGDPSHALLVEEIISTCKRHGVFFAANSLFVQALSRTIQAKEINIKRLKSKIKSHAQLFEKQPNLQAYQKSLEDVYNRQARDKIPLSFLTDEAAKTRSATYSI